MNEEESRGSKIESFANFHVRTNGWPEIDCHLIINPKYVVNGKVTAKLSCRKQ
ncbi:hypothetical protein ACBZ92_06240 [Priestia aryabhattai]|uniref:hypothetical protein n=1 Tax=Priestia aryabhattai TaxID=412384 RepID=UPI003569CF60